MKNRKICGLWNRGPKRSGQSGFLDCAGGFYLSFTFLVQAGFSIALCCGVRWVRWLFVAGGVIGAASTFLLLIQAADIGGMPAWFFAYGIFVLLVSVLTGILLAWYRPVKEFFYQKKNG